MKKILALVLMTSLVTSTFASTSDSHSVIIENNEKTDSFSLNTITTRTEYRTEVVRDICYRQELVGYRRVCNGYGYYNQTIQVAGLENVVGPHPAPGPHPHDPGSVGKPGPMPGPRPMPGPHPAPGPTPWPRPEPRPVCYDQPIYRQVSYSCSRTISVPYEVDDHQSTANVSARISPAPKSLPQTGSCGINFSLTGDNFQAINTCNEYLAMAQINRQDLGNVKNYSYSIELYDAQKVFAPLAGGLSEMQMEGEGNVLLVRSGDLRSNSNYTLNLFVERRHFFKSDKVLINRALSSSEFSYQPIDDRTGFIRIDLSKVAPEFKRGKKHAIKVNLSVRLPEGSVINGSGIPSLTQESSIKIR